MAKCNQLTPLPFKRSINSGDKDVQFTDIMRRLLIDFILRLLLLLLMKMMMVVERPRSFHGGRRQGVLQLEPIKSLS